MEFPKVEKSNDEKKDDSHSSKKLIVNPMVK
jgi:hypothetical protein